MTSIEIKNYITDAVIYTYTPAEGSPLRMRDAVESAIRDGINLSHADLRRVYLHGADLSGADLFRSYLHGANLDGADLSDANLDGADLSGVNLSRANLSRANLTCANLNGVDLTDANLKDSNLSRIKADYFDVIEWALHDEVIGLRAALVEGRVAGTVYEGDCACLVGTIARIRGVSYTELWPRAGRPIEKFFLAIEKGDTPATSQFSALAVEWLDEFLAPSA